MVLIDYDQLHVCEWWVHLSIFQTKDISESEWRVFAGYDVEWAQNLRKMRKVFDQVKPGWDHGKTILSQVFQWLALTAVATHPPMYPSLLG